MVRKVVQINRLPKINQLQNDVWILVVQTQSENI